MSHDDRDRRPDPRYPGEPQLDDELEAGAYIGRGEELASETVPDGVQRNDDRIAGTASQSTGPGGRAANPGDGWEDAPEGHREGPSADDDLLRAKG